MLLRRAMSRLRPHRLVARAEPRRAISAALPSRADGESNPLEEPRDSMDYDLVVVGAGPAGLAAAIRFKQLAAEAGEDLSAIVLEKGHGEDSQREEGGVRGLLSVRDCARRSAASCLA